MSLLLFSGGKGQGSHGGITSDKKVVFYDALVQMLDALKLETEHREILVESDIGEELDAILLRMDHFLTIDDTSGTSLSDLNGILVLYSYLISKSDDLANWSDSSSEDLLIWTEELGNYSLSFIDSFILSDSFEALMNYFNNVSDNLNTLNDELKLLMLYLLTIDDDSNTSLDDAIDNLTICHSISDIESDNSSNWLDDNEIIFSYLLSKGDILSFDDSLDTFMTHSFGYNDNLDNWLDESKLIFNHLIEVDDDLNTLDDGLDTLMTYSNTFSDDLNSWSDEEGILLIFTYLIKTLITETEQFNWTDDPVDITSN